MPSCAATSTDGVDVAGSIGGVAATGSGQSLTGGQGGDAEGLKIEVSGGATGSRGTISFCQGYALQHYADRALKGIVGFCSFNATKYIYIIRT